MEGLIQCVAELDCGCMIFEYDDEKEPIIKIECCPTHKKIEVNIGNKNILAS